MSFERSSKMKMLVGARPRSNVIWGLVWDKLFFGGLSGDLMRVGGSSGINCYLGARPG